MEIGELPVSRTGGRRRLNEGQPAAVLGTVSTQPPHRRPELSEVGELLVSRGGGVEGWFRPVVAVLIEGEASGRDVWLSTTGPEKRGPILRVRSARGDVVAVLGGKEARRLRKGDHVKVQRTG